MSGAGVSGHVRGGSVRTYYGREYPDMSGRECLDMSGAGESGHFRAGVSGNLKGMSVRASQGGSVWTCQGRESASNLH